MSTKYRGIKMALPPVTSPPLPPTSQSGINQSAAESWCYTQMQAIKFSFKWTINNFIHRQEDTCEFLNSSTFSASSNDKLKWQLQLYPNGENEDSSDYLSLYLVLVSSDKIEVPAQFKFTILNAQKEEKGDSKYSEVCRFTQGEKCGYKKFIPRYILLEEVNGLLPDEMLTLYCEVRVLGDSINISGQDRAVQFKTPECHICNDFGQFFDEQKFSDVILSVNGKEFSAHKVILAARSPVFYAMFEHEMEEKNRQRVEITDMDHEVLREMLRYIYTGKVSNIENMAGDLLAAADKYALDPLKIMCEEHICSILSVGTAAEALIFADMHSAHQLKAHVIDFISMHATHVMDTAGWKTMIQTRPHLVAEPFRVLASQQISTIEPPSKRMKL